MNLTPRSYLLVVIIVVLGILSEWGWSSLDSIWRLLAAALLLGLILEGLLSRNQPVTMQRQLPAAAGLGQPLTYELAVSNTMDLPLIMRSMETLPALSAELPQVMHWQVEGGDTVKQNCQLTPIYLGQLVWDRIQLRLRGRFGLAWWSRRLHLPDTIPVIPDRLKSSEYKKAATEHQGDITRRVSGSGHELLGLREYQYGDPLHFIDWKATARSGKPTVRLFSDEQRLELILAIDAGRTSGMQAGSLTRLGHYTNVAARLAEKAMHNGDQVSLVVFADEVSHQLKGLRGHNGLQTLRKTLESLSPMPRESNPLTGIMQVRNLAHHRSLVVVLTDLDDGDAANQLVKAMSILRPKHQPVLAAICDNETVALQQQTADDWVAPYHSLAASEMIQNWEHTRYKLQRLGVPVVLATVDHLDQQVLASYDQMKIRHRI